MREELDTHDNDHCETAYNNHGSNEEVDERLAFIFSNNVRNEALANKSANKTDEKKPDSKEGGQHALNSELKSGGRGSENDHERGGGHADVREHAHLHHQGSFDETTANAKIASDNSGESRETGKLGQSLGGPLDISFVKLLS